MAIRFSILLAAVSLVVVWVAGSDQTLKAADEDEPKLVCLAATSFAETCLRKEPLPVAVALANRQREPIWVSRDEPIILLRRADGGPVKCLAFSKPQLPPPLDWWIERGGERVLVVPVHELPALAGDVTVVENALEEYEVEPGEYIITVQLDLALFRREAVFERDGKEGTWADADTPAQTMSIRSNPVRVMITN